MPSDAVILFRVSSSVKRSYEERAKARGLSLSKWIIAQLDGAPIVEETPVANKLYVDTKLHPSKKTVYTKKKQPEPKVPYGSLLKK